MTLFKPRLMYAYAFMSIVAMFFIAMYLQFVKGINPCPLCIVQRIALAFLAVFFFLGMLFQLKKFGRFFVGGFAFIISAAGATLAGRQVWLQHLPPNKSAECGVSLQYMLQVLPLDQVLKKVLQGTADCSQLEWTLFGFSLAEWTLFWFVIFALFALWQTCRRSE